MLHHVDLKLIFQFIKPRNIQGHKMFICSWVIPNISILDLLKNNPSRVSYQVFFDDKDKLPSNGAKILIILSLLISFLVFSSSRLPGMHQIMPHFPCPNVVYQRSKVFTCNHLPHQHYTSMQYSHLVSFICLTPNSYHTILPLKNFYNPYP